ncbi:Thiol-disulfide oxidoreductase ResA [compost metagenome]
MKALLAAVLCLPLVALAVKPAKEFEKIEFRGITAAPLKEGSPLSREDLKGKVVVIDFWASWCGPCKVAIPHYNTLHKKYQDKGVIFVGINEDDDIKARDAFLNKADVEFPMYQDSNQKFAKSFNVVALPSLFVLNKEHKVVALFRGFDKSKPESLDKLLQELIEKN